MLLQPELALPAPALINGNDGAPHDLQHEAAATFAHVASQNPEPRSGPASMQAGEILYLQCFGYPHYQQC